MQVKTVKSRHFLKKHAKMAGFKVKWIWKFKFAMDFSPSSEEVTMATPIW
jgi:hypothetical protein